MTAISGGEFLVAVAFDRAESLAELGLEAGEHRGILLLSSVPGSGDLGSQGVTGGLVLPLEVGERLLLLGHDRRLLRGRLGRPLIRLSFVLLIHAYRLLVATGGEEVEARLLQSERLAGGHAKSVRQVGQRAAGLGPHPADRHQAAADAQRGDATSHAEGDGPRQAEAKRQTQRHDDGQHERQGDRRGGESPAKRCLCHLEAQERARLFLRPRPQGLERRLKVTRRRLRGRHGLDGHGRHLLRTEKRIHLRRRVAESLDGSGEVLLRLGEQPQRIFTLLFEDLAVLPLLELVILANLLKLSVAVAGELGHHRLPLVVEFLPFGREVGPGFLKERRVFLPGGVDLPRVLLVGGRERLGRLLLEPSDGGLVLLVDLDFLPRACGGLTPQDRDLFTQQVTAERGSDGGRGGSVCGRGGGRGGFGGSRAHGGLPCREGDAVGAAATCRRYRSRRGWPGRAPPRAGSGRRASP